MRKDEKKKVVLLINPFSSIRYLLDYFKSRQIQVFAFFTRKELERSGYVLSELNKVQFDLEILGSRELNKDLDLIRKTTSNYELIYSFICSELEDYAYCEQLNEKLTPQYTNDPSTASLRFNKYCMNEALRNNKINCVEQKIASQYKKHDIMPPYAVKPIKESCSANGVVFFENEYELLQYIENLSNKENFVVQKKISGEEYIIDYFSCKNQHYLVGLSQHSLDNDAIPIAQSLGNVGIIFSKVNVLLEYTRSVLQALEVYNGFSHIEVMVNQSTTLWS